MNRKILMAITATVLSLTCMAEEVPVLSMHTDSDSTVISLKDIIKVQYNDTEMIVLLTDGSAKGFAMDRILSMAFLNVDDKELTPTAVGFTTKESESGTDIFDLNGIRQGCADTKGLYIIKKGKETKKVLK